MPTAAKPALFSVTIWGLIFSAVCTLFPALAVWLHLSDPGTQSAIETLAAQIGTVIGLAIALYGRIRAVAPIAGVITTPAPIVAAPSLVQVESVAETVIGDLAAPPKPPGATAAAIFALFMIGIVILGSGALTACTTPSAATTASSVQLDEGKALATIVTASDALADALDAGAKSGAVTGANATAARQALMNLQVGLSLAQTAYAAQDGTAAQRIAALATLLDDAEKALPVSLTTSQAVDEAIAAAVAVANAY